MNFSKISYKSRLGKLLRWPLRLIPSDAVVPIMQGQLKGKKWVAGSHYYGCWLGSYEYDKRLFFERTIPKGSVVLDIGANVGFYSLLSSILVGQEGRVYAFEPSNRNLHFLKRHLDLNKIKNVEVIEAAVGDEMGEVYFDDNFTVEDKSGQRNYGSSHISNTGKAKVRLVALDELYRQQKIAPPQYIKMDVEGAELMALKGAIKLLSEVHPTIFLATHSSTLHKECADFLRELGYTLQSMNGADLNDTDELLATYNK